VESHCYVGASRPYLHWMIYRPKGRKSNNVDYHCKINLMKMHVRNVTFLVWQRWRLRGAAEAGAATEAGAAAAAEASAVDEEADAANCE